MGVGIPLVSIIIPVYNAEQSIIKMLESLQFQRQEHVELVFIDDCSRDGSSSIIESYKSRFESKGWSLKVIVHDINKGVAAARNTGLNHATGEYIYYVDADDRLEPDALELLVQEAQENDAEIVGCNWFLSFEKNERKMNQPAFQSNWEAIERILRGTMRWNLWLFLVKRSLYEAHHIRFIPGMNMGEDIMVMIKLFTYAERVGFVNQALYHYGQGNAESLTKTYSDKHRAQVTANVQEIERFLLLGPHQERIRDLLAALKLNIKLPLLVTGKRSDMLLWQNWFSEANDYATKDPQINARIRILQGAAVRGWYAVIWCHYVLVVKVVYGIIYK